ncbi:MAG: insulinase family protein, partial [Bacteroidota bacterium]
AYNERNNNESSDYTWACFSHFLNNEPMPGDEFSYKFTSSTLPGISLEEVNQLAEKWITDNNVIIVVTGPDNENITIPDETTIREIYNKTIEQKVDPYKEIVVDKPLLSEKPNPSPVVEEKKDEQSGVIRWKLKNGAIVIIKPTDFKKDEVYFRAFSPGGSSLYPDKDYMSASVATEVAGESGLGEFSNIEMRKLLSGKIISLRHSIGEYREDINGVTRPQDIEMFLQMVYLSFTSPRIEESGLNLYLEKQKTRTDNRKLDPSSALWDTVTVTLGQYNYRRRPWSMELLKEAQLDRINAIYRERFSNAADFTFIIVGSVDPETLKPLVETYIGGIPSTGKTEKWKDLNIRYPNGIIEKKVPAEMKVPKGTAYITFTGKAEYSLENRVLLDAIADILDVRYTETIREEQGGTYGVSVRAGINHIPADELYMVINFDCDPGRISDLMNIAYAEIEALKTKGPEQKYVDNFIKNKEKEREEKLRENRYWSNFLYNKYLYGSQETEDQYIEQVRKITADDVKNAAAGLFPNNDHVQIILVPKE